MSARSAAMLATLAIGVLVAAACFSERQADLTGLSTACATLARDAGVESGVVIGIEDFAFAPTDTHVSRGERVTWINCENDPGLPHTATAKDGSWSSPDLLPGQIYSRVFDAEGTVDYYCKIHPSMQAKVTVE